MSPKQALAEALEIKRHVDEQTEKIKTTLATKKLEPEVVDKYYGVLIKFDTIRDRTNKAINILKKETQS